MYLFCVISRLWISHRMRAWAFTIHTHLCVSRSALFRIVALCSCARTRPSRDTEWVWMYAAAFCCPPFPSPTIEQFSNQFIKIKMRTNGLSIQWRFPFPIYFSLVLLFHTHFATLFGASHTHTHTVCKHQALLPAANRIVVWAWYFASSRMSCTVAVQPAAGAHTMYMLIDVRTPSAVAGRSRPSSRAMHMNCRCVCKVPHLNLFLLLLLFSTSEWWSLPFQQ